MINQEPKLLSSVPYVSIDHPSSFFVLFRGVWTP